VLVDDLITRVIDLAVKSLDSGFIPAAPASVPPTPGIG